MSVWTPVILRSLTLGIIGLLLGSAFGHPWIGLSFILSCYGLWHLYNLYVLHRWLVSTRAIDLPDGFGIWEEIYSGLIRIQRRERDKKRKLGKIVRRFQKSSSAMPDGVIVFDTIGQISWFNTAAAGYLGFKNDDVGQRVGNLIRIPKFIEFFNNRDFTKPIQISPVHNPDLHLSISIVPYDNNQYLMMVRDVSHVQRLENMRGEFIANASHELRTPLTVIRGYMDSLSDDVDELPNHWQKAFTAINDQSKHMQRMVDDLMLSLRMESATDGKEKSPVNLAEIIEACCAEFKNLVGDDIKITTNIDTSLSIPGSKPELESVVRNLVSNAVNYMPANKDNAEVNVKWQLNAQQQAELTVKDNGVGIAVHHLGSLTDRFYRINNLPGRLQQGTGLGLSIVAQALERHGSELKIASVVGQGSTFSCSFTPTHH